MVKQVEEKVKKIIKNELNLPALLPEAHRVGKVKEMNGKKSQDIIIHFKSHSARYEVFSKRKSLRNKKAHANLTQSIGKLLYKAKLLVEKLDKVALVYILTYVVTSR